MTVFDLDLTSFEVYDVTWDPRISSTAAQLYWYAVTFLNVFRQLQTCCAVPLTKETPPRPTLPKILVTRLFLSFPLFSTARIHHSVLSTVLETQTWIWSTGHYPLIFAYFVKTFMIQSTFSPVNAATSNGPYVNRAVTIWAEPSKAIASLARWLEARFC